MGFEVKKTTNNDKALLKTLGAVADTAVARALQCLDDLGTRESDADHDRGARSAECLMRVATAAASLSARLQKDDAHGENAEAGQGLSDADIERRARELTERFERALQERDEIDQKAGRQEPEQSENRLSGDAPRFLHGGRS